MYLVLFSTSYSTSIYEPAHEIGYMWQKPEGNRTIAMPTLSMEVFEDEQEAADFAKKHDGYILIPAEINSKILVKDKV